jgi:hypothetical protein
MLRDGDLHPQADVTDRIRTAASGQGWHDRATGQAPDATSVGCHWHALLRTLTVLALAQEGGDWQARTTASPRSGRHRLAGAAHPRDRPATRPAPLSRTRGAHPANSARRPTKGPQAEPWEGSHDRC